MGSGKSSRRNGRAGLTCLAVDIQRIQPISGLSTGRRCGRRVQRQVHDQSDGVARWVNGHAGKSHTAQLPEFLPSRQALAVQWRSSGTRRLTGKAYMRDDSALGLAAGSVADAALSGLLQPRKTLPAELFYDEEGCRLFGRITELPEYYLTRTERALLADVAPRVADLVRRPAVLVEYGASDEAKAEFLLREGAFRAYVPIDVAEPQLE